MSSKGSGRRAQRTGVVVSNAMNKTVVVEVERLESHGLYHRRYKRTSKYYAHDEKNACRIGDKVVIVETRPLSRMKRWRVKEIMTRAESERAVE
jgi:small subunit ribosomal protein S17